MTGEPEIYEPAVARPTPNAKTAGIRRTTKPATTTCRVDQQWHRQPECVLEATVGEDGETWSVVVEHYDPSYVGKLQRPPVDLDTAAIAAARTFTKQMDTLTTAGAWSREEVDDLKARVMALVIESAPDA